MARKVLSGSKKKASRRVESSNGSWIHRPALDLIIGCGAWSAPLLLLAYPLGVGDKVLMSTAFYGLALAFNYPHFMATLYRAYRTRDEVSRYRIFTLHITLVFLATLILAHWAYGMVAWIFTIYITWSPWHYTGQNFGLAMMFARRNGATPTASARQALHLAFWASYVLIFINFHTGPSTDPYLISIGLPGSLGAAATIVLGVLFCVLGFWSWRSMARQVGGRAMLPTLVLLTTQFVWFVAPFVWQLATGGHVPQTRYSSGILAVLHAAQYLWITSFYARRETEASARPWRPWAYSAILALGGIAVFIPGPWLVSYLFHFDFTASFLIFTSLVNIHHFLLDGALWKLRDGRIAALLINTQEKVSDRATGAAGALGNANRWVFGTSTPARALRGTVAAALLSLAAMDLARYYLASDDKNMARLTKAESLNPYDQALLVRIAREHGRNGSVDQTIADLERAVAVNPDNADPQNQLARLLLENGLNERAYAHYRQMIERLPRDVDALVNFGMLASQLGRDDEALDSWERAVSADPNQKNVRLYMAEAYERQEKAQPAIAQYESYLALLAQDPDARLDPKEVIGLTLKLARSYGQMKQFDRTLTYAQKAAELSAQAGEKSMLSAAYSVLAQALTEGGKGAEALSFYQRSIQLDRETGESQQEGLAWFKYGQFLKRSGQSDRLVLACLIKAEQLLKPGRGKEVDLIAEARRQEERTLGKDAAMVGRDLDSLLSELLTLEL
jgi:tetratricopeptide (TPR) repeat protein